MRVSTRLLILKLLLAAAVLAVLLVAMHVLLPGLLGRGGSAAPGEGSAAAETPRVRVVLPRAAGGLPAGSRAAAQIAGHVESFVQAFCTQFGPALGLQRPSERLSVTVFTTQAEAAAFAEEHKLRQDPAHPGAFYGPASLAIAVTDRPHPGLLGLILHVATHVLMDRAASEGDAQWSPWLSVGMAVCAEQGALTGAAGQAVRRDAVVVLSLASRAAQVPLHMLVHGGPELFRGPLGSLAYRESGLFVLFLLRSGPKRREAFLRYLSLERPPGPVPPGGLESTLGIPITELEKEWFAFLQALVR